MAHHVWISDALLARSFAQFATAPRRYGSNVPGPLEARRRLARRRNANLAMVGGGSAGVDPSLLFGWKNSDRRKRVETPFGSFFQGQEPPSISPPLLNGTPERSVPTPKSEAMQAWPFVDIAASLPVPSDDQVLAEKLLKMTSLEGIRALVADLGVDLYGQPHLSQLIFKRALEAYWNESTWTIADIGDFLGDPTLNTLGSKNFVVLAQSLVTNPAPKREVERAFGMLKHMLSLGAVPRNEIYLILKLVPRIRVSDAVTNNIATIHGICYKAIWDGLTTCSVLQPKDIGRRALTLWLHLLGRISPSGHSLSVSKGIIRLLTAVRTGHYSWLQNALLQIIRLKAIRTPKTATVSYWRHFHTYIQDINHIGWLFPRRILLGSIFRVTELLSFSRQYRKNRRKLLRIWGEILEQSELGPVFHEDCWRIFQLPVNEVRSSFCTRQKMFRPRRFMTRRKDFMRQRWLLRLWLIKTMGRKTHYQREVESRRKEFFRKLLVYNKRLRGSRPIVDFITYLHGFMRRLGRLGLPHADAVFTTTTRIEYERRLCKYQKLPKDVLIALSQVECGSLSPSDIFWDDRQYSLLRDKLLGHWEKLARQTDVTAPDFANKVLLYTETNSPRRSGLLRILRRHTPFKIALAYSWNSSSVGAFDGKLRGATSFTADGFPILNPADCLATMHSLALIFACSTKLSPRNSYRLTRWCYEFILAHYAPIKPTMARALYHAGVYRYREAGMIVPLERFAYIMDIVRNVEGDAIAGALASGVPFEFISR
ncbi:hypothetical protein PRK78_003505 [Emydomyces testavorans]|uniref:Uncharacterized protein n=1 Tax=Emydomyces testavorans TaxID=2070801 RepID=A0AAF0DGX2_9EURO|nr:hypothetical protein PRK78_003505 [Emydomyces testavorans]